MSTYMELNVTTLKAFSLYRIEKYVKLERFWKYTCVILQYSVAIPCIVGVYVNRADGYVKLAEDIANIACYFGGIFSMHYYHFQVDKIVSTVQRMEETFRYTSEAGIYSMTMDGHRKLAKLVTLIWCTFVFASAVIVCSMPLFNSKKKLAINGVYFFDWTTSPNYQLLLLLQLFSQVTMAMCYGSSDMFYMSVVILTKGQIEVLVCNLRNVVYTALLRRGVSKSTVEKLVKARNNNLYLPDISAYEDDIQKALNHCIKHHQKLMSFCEFIIATYSPMVLCKFAISLFFLTFLIFSIMIAESWLSVIPLVQYLMCGSIEMFQYSYFAQVLKDESLRLGDAIYETPWYLCSRRYKSSMVMVMQCIRPIQVTAGMFVVSINLFVGTLKTAFSYITVLRQMSVN